MNEMKGLRLDTFTGLHSIKLIIGNAVQVNTSGYLVSIQTAYFALEKSRVVQIHLFIFLLSSNDNPFIALLASTKHRAKLPG